MAKRVDIVAQLEGRIKELEGTVVQLTRYRDEARRALEANQAYTRDLERAQSTASERASERERTLTTRLDALKRVLEAAHVLASNGERSAADMFFGVMRPR